MPSENWRWTSGASGVAWRPLERYHDDLVLVGGLAVHYLTKKEATQLPGSVTMEVDFGVALGASGGQYGTIKL